MTDVKTLTKKVRGYPGYEVTEDGRVLSLKYGRPHFLRQATDSIGRKYVSVVSATRVKQSRSVHSLVMLAWGPPRPSPRHEIRHLNGRPDDNRRRNLKWGTRRDNARDRERHGRTARGERHGAAKLTTEQVRKIRALVADGMPVKHAGRLFGISQPHSRRIVERRNWKHV